MTDDLRAEPTMESDPEGEALARYFAGESDPEEASRVEAWLADRPVDQSLVASLRAHEAAVERTRTDALSLTVDTEAALQSVRARMADLDESRLATPTSAPALRVARGGASEPVAPPAPRSVAARSSSRAPANATAKAGANATASRRSPWRGLGLAVAAGLAAIVVMKSRTPSTPDFVQEFRTAVGTTDTVSLIDGTRVVLAPGSALTLTDSYATGARTVTLDGAAHFTVTHDSTRPFVVQMDGVAVRDIGTAFTVKSMADGGVSVVVTEGRVAVAPRAAAAEVELAAGDRGDVVADSLHVARGVAGEADLAWTRGELAYRDASLAEVRADLRRWYGVTLEVGDRTLAARTITARFSGDSLAQVLQVLSLALGADVAQRGDTIRLVPQNGSQGGSQGGQQGAPPAAGR